MAELRVDRMGLVVSQRGVHRYAWEVLCNQSHQTINNIDVLLFGS